MSFFSELKRRNVFRVGIAYAVATWVLLQIVDLVLDNIAAPEWVMQVFMLALAIGFPIAIIMAWAFEMTPDGIKREAEVDRSQSTTAQTGQTLNRIIMGSLVLAVIFLIIDPFEEPAQPVVADPATNQASTQTEAQDSGAIDKSVAVLPFANRSTNPDDAFFAEGMHDDLLTQLAKIGSIKVISRTSVLAYKDTTLKIPQIARELGVATIVEGGIQRSGSRIRVNAQLINAQTDEHLWAETYNRELTAENLFDIQAEIARSIAQALKATLSDEEEASIGRVLTNNLTAWQSYQRASVNRQVFTNERMKAGLSELDLALELDPNFAAAWGLRAILLLQQYWFFDTNPSTREAGWDAIQAGRVIDPTLPELDIAEGYYYWGFRDYTNALKLMQKALAVLPNSSEAVLGVAYVQRRLGYWEESLAGMRRAIELDPMYLETIGELGDTLRQLHRFEEAAEIFTTIESVAVNNSTILWQLANFQFWTTGDVANYTHVLHLAESANPEAQMSKFYSSLFTRDWQSVFEDIENWPERFLDSKLQRVTRQMLTGLTWRYSGDFEKATPLLSASKQEFEALLAEDGDNHPILQSLCMINAGLGDIKAAKQSCADSLAAAPSDAYIVGEFEFEAAKGLALAVDAQGAIKLLDNILSSGMGPTVYFAIYHPAFDGIRQDPAYIELMRIYAPEHK